MIDAYADSLGMLYVGAALSGIGAGAIYATCVGNAVKWFPDRRGLAVGITAGGFGAGAALTVIPIRLLIESAGYSQRLLLVRPRPGRDPAADRADHARADAGRDAADGARRRCRNRPTSFAPAEMLAHAGVLAALRDVRAGRPPAA